MRQARLGVTPHYSLKPSHFKVHRLWAVRCFRGRDLNPAVIIAGGQASAIYRDGHGGGGGPIFRGSLDPGRTLGGCPVEGPTTSVADVEGSTRVAPEATTASWDIDGRVAESEPCPAESDSGGPRCQALGGRGGASRRL